MFPSPLGDCVFNRFALEQEYKLIDSCFRPLSGIVFSIFEPLRNGATIRVFPSPLGDCVFNPCLLKPAPCLIPH